MVILTIIAKKERKNCPKKAVSEIFLSFTAKKKRGPDKKLSETPEIMIPDSAIGEPGK
jgi:hypothetical protein